MQMSPGTLTPSQRLLLLNLAWHANEHGENAFPAVPTISRETSLCRRAVQMGLRRLKDKGFLIDHGTRARRSVCYALNLQAIDCASRAQSKADGVSDDCALDAQS